MKIKIKKILENVDFKKKSNLQVSWETVTLFSIITVDYSTVAITLLTNDGIIFNSKIVAALSNKFFNDAAKNLNLPT